MNKVVIDLKNSFQALNEFNEDIISDSLHNYLMNIMEHRSFKDLKIVIKGSDSEKVKKAILNFYQNKYVYAKKFDDLENYLRVITFIIGVIAIFIAKELSSVFSEIFLIAGWVMIWEIIYDVLFKELKRKKQTKIYKILANSNNYS